MRPRAIGDDAHVNSIAYPVDNIIAKKAPDAGGHDEKRSIRDPVSIGGLRRRRRMTTPRRPGARDDAPVPVRVTSHYQDALFARGQETITCTLVASRIEQMEHEPISARPMLLRDDAIYAKSRAC